MKNRFPPAILSLHAIQRLSERFKISKEQILSDLNGNLGRKIGVSKETNLMHRLLWSTEDACFLVAIQDVISGTVLTFLTLEMYKRDHPEFVTESRLNKVINQLVTRGRLPQELLSSYIPPSSNKVLVVGYFSDSQFFPATPKHIGAYNIQSDPCDIADLGSRPEFWEWVCNKMQEKNLSFDHLRSIYGRMNHCDNRVAITYQVQEPSTKIREVPEELAA